MKTSLKRKERKPKEIVRIEMSGKTARVLAAVLGRIDVHEMYFLRSKLDNLLHDEVADWDCGEAAKEYTGEIARK